MNSRRKGSVGEREWARYCQTQYGLDGARRTQQFCGTAGTCDVESWPGTHAEVKRVERLNIEAAMAQAVADAGAGAIPYVAHRRNRGEWMVTVRASDLLAFVSSIRNERP